MLGLMKKHAPHARRVLDMGCGAGDMTAKVAGFARELFGVDIDDQRLQEALKKGIIAVKVDLNSDKLPFQGDYFDLIIMAEIIEHLYNPDHALSEAYRVLRSDGYLLLTTPNLAWWINRLILLIGYQPYLTNVSLKYDVGKFLRNPFETGCTGQHIRIFTPKALEQLLEIMGFRIVDIKGATLDLLPKPIKYLDKFIASLRPSLAADIIMLLRKQS